MFLSTAGADMQGQLPSLYVGQSSVCDLLGPTGSCTVAVSTKTTSESDPMRAIHTWSLSGEWFFSCACLLYFSHGYVYNPETEPGLALFTLCWIRPPAKSIKGFKNVKRQ